MKNVWPNPAASGNGAIKLQSDVMGFGRAVASSNVGFMRKFALLAFSLGMVVILSGCVYALHKSNTPGTEKIRLVVAPGSQYAIRIENHGETAVPADGTLDLIVPRLPGSCSVYLFGLIKIRDGDPESLRIIQVLREGKIVRRLSLHVLQKLPADKDGYRLIRL